MARTVKRRKAPEYRHIYYDMVKRCYYPDFKCYKDYGGRGIEICKRWLSNKYNFFEDMGDRPGPNYSIDRIDNDGHYSCGKCPECIRRGWPMNVKWADGFEQANKTRKNRNITFNGETKTLSQWIRWSGLNPAAVKMRFYVYKWDIGRCLLTPLRQRG
jgi:hypothetical protein